MENGNRSKRSEMEEMIMNQKRIARPGAVLFLVRLLQGMMIGLGAVLPGISGGVLCVIFGIYKPVMELLASPLKRFRTHVPKLLPVILGAGAGFLGIANLLSFFLEKYPDPSVCLFIGLIGGMYPSLMREAGEKGRTKASWISMGIAFALILILLGILDVMSVNIEPNGGWYLFCGFCLALSIIAPGMSFSTLLMPLGLYTPFVAGIGHLDLKILVFGGIGAVLTVICLARGIDALFWNHYSAAFHAIAGIVAAATLAIIPFGSFFRSGVSFAANVLCLCIGILCAMGLDKINRKFPREG